MAGAVLVTVELAKGTLPNLKVSVIMTLSLGSLPPPLLLASWQK